MKTLPYFFTIIACSLSFLVNSQTVGTVRYNSELAQDGYTLMAPLGHNSTYLLNNCGEIINRWESEYAPGNEVFLTEEGNLWRAGKFPGEGLIGTGGRGGIIELLNWEGELLWSYERCSTEECMHHDFKLLPNGNLLILVWKAHTYDQGIAAGQSLFEMKQYDAAREEFEKWKDESLQAKYQLGIILTLCFYYVFFFCLLVPRKSGSNL